MAFVQVLLPIGDGGQARVADAVQARYPAPGEHFLVLRCPPEVGKVAVVAALEAAGLRGSA